MKNTQHKVAILGKLPTKFKAPFNDLDYDIWAFNWHEDVDKLKRVDKWFDIHRNNPNPIANINRNNFPFQECSHLVGGNYFNNTASYLIAFAILEGYTEIELYGMRFDAESEIRKQEYHNVRELIFFAKGRGIKISCPVDKPLMREYELYG